MATRSTTAGGKGGRAPFRISAFRLALLIGLFFTFLHYLEVASLARDAEVPVVSRLEYAAQDYVMTRLRSERRPSGDVIIVAIDEKSVRAEGLWRYFWHRAGLRAGSGFNLSKMPTFFDVRHSRPLVTFGGLCSARKANPFEPGQYEDRRMR